MNDMKVNLAEVYINMEHKTNTRSTKQMTDKGTGNRNHSLDQAANALITELLIANFASYYQRCVKSRYQAKSADSRCFEVNF